MIRCLCVVLAGSCIVASARADKALDFILHTTSGKSLTGPVLQIGDGWSIEHGGESAGRTEGAQLISLRQRGVALPARPTDEQLILSNGDQIPGAVRSLAGETLLFAPLAPTREWKAPLSAVAAIWFSTPDGVRHADAFRRRLAAGKRTRDAVMLRNGDIREGILTRLDRTTIVLEVDRREVTVRTDKVAVVALNTELTRFPKPKQPYAHAVLMNGCRVALTAARVDGNTVRGKTLLGPEIAFPLSELAALDVRQGSAVYLSDLQPARYQFTPYLNEQWPLVRDGSVAGRDMRLDDGTFDKGLGMHSETRLTYDISAGYQRLEALVGLDQHSGVIGHVTIQVLVDGKPQDVGVSELSGQNGAQPIRVNITGGRELTLIVGFGKGGHVQDHVNWADARLVK